MPAADSLIRVLVVEDSPEIRLALELGLAHEGCEVISAVDGVDGVAKFKRTDPDFILLDLRMPGMDGTEVCKEIRKSSSVPVIVYSAVDDSDEVKRAIEAGASDFVLKSSGLNELIDRFHRHVAKNHASGPEAATKTVAAPAKHSLDVLVLDPNWQSAEAVAAEIKKLGHTVEVMRQTDRATGSRKRPDVLLLDYAMPKRVGIDFAEDLSGMAGEYQMGLIVISGSNPADLRRRLRRCMLLDFIQKPWSPRDLPLRLGTALRLYAQRTRRTG